MKSLRAGRSLILLLIGSLSLSGLVSLPGCAPRYLDKTPGSALRYPYIPVNPEELTGFRDLLAQSPYDPGAIKARFWIAQNAFNRSEWATAEKKFLNILKKYPHDPWAPVAGVMTARARVKRKKNLAALAGLRRLSEQYAGQPRVVQTVAELARTIINDELDLAELVRVRATYSGTPWDEQALFVMGKRHLDFGNPDSAIKLFEQFLAAYPGSEFVPLARDLKEKAIRIVPLNRNRVGCLLPLSGPYAPFGKTIRQGLEQALRKVNRRQSLDDQLSLAVGDTRGTTDGARDAFRELLDREKVMMIIGPALSACARALLPELRWHRITLLTPAAADPELPAASPYMFRYMLTNQEQGEAMAEYVVLRKNLQRVGILNGEAAYDRSLAEAFEAKVKELGGEVILRMEYPRGATDFKSQLLALGGVDPGYLKDLTVRERKRMGKIVETVALGFHRKLAPEQASGTPVPTPTVIPDQRVAIIRLTEKGEQCQRERLGKLFTEKISYALAPREGVKVLTQADTFKALRKLGLSSLALGRGDWHRLGEQLDVAYLVMGSIEQKGEKPVSLPGEPLPVQYEIKVKLVAAATGRLISKYAGTWTKSIPPEYNVKDMEGIYLPVPARDAILIASQLAFYDLQVEIFGCDAWMTPKFLRHAGKELNGAVLATGYWPNDQAGRNREFIREFEERYSARPTSLAVQAYDAMHLVAQVLQTIQHPNPKRDDFEKALREVKRFRGVTGSIVIDPDGEIRREPVFLKYDNDKLKRVR